MTTDGADNAMAVDSAGGAPVIQEPASEEARNAKTKAIEQNAARQAKLQADLNLPN